jgi:excisionase family DNA binding protein
MTPAELVADGLMSVAQTAEFLAVSTRSVWNLMASGDLPFVHCGRFRRIPRRAVVQWAAKHMHFGLVQSS